MRRDRLEAKSKAVALAQGMAEAAFTQKISLHKDGELQKPGVCP